MNIFFWRKPKVVEIANGFLALVPHPYGGYTAIETHRGDRTKPHRFHDPAHVKQWCIFATRQDAEAAIERYKNPPRTIDDDIKDALK